MFKRLIEIFISILLAVILLVPISIIYIIILINSKSNPIFWSQRIGKNNKIFNMPKFRTMNINTPVVASHLMSNPSNNITKIGCILRSYSLDEIPQLYSIIKGDITFIGPRPALYNQYDLIDLRTKAHIHMIKPGITGWAQVNGRDHLTIEEKVKYDIEYLGKKSLRFNLYILFLTFVKIIKKSDISH